MTPPDVASHPSQSPPAPSPPTDVIVVSPRELLGLTLAVWLGGVFILTLLPYLLNSRIGGAMAITISYLVFFLAWQPVHIVTQRAQGVQAAFIRTLIFIAGAATVAAWLRQMLPSLTGTM